MGRIKLNEKVVGCVLALAALAYCINDAYAFQRETTFEWNEVIHENAIGYALYFRVENGLATRVEFVGTTILGYQESIEVEKGQTIFAEISTVGRDPDTQEVYESERALASLLVPFDAPAGVQSGSITLTEVTSQAEREDFTGAETNGFPLAGVWGDFDFTDEFRFAGPWQTCEGNMLYTSTNRPLGTFSFTGVRVTQMEFCASSSGTLTISNENGESQTAAVNSGVYTVTPLDWQPHSTVTIDSSIGYAYGVNAIEYEN